MPVTVTGAEQLGRLARAIRQAGDKDLQRELASGLRRAVRPMQREFKQVAGQVLPYRGGLAEFVVAGMRFRSKVSVGKSPRVRITASLPGHDLDAMNRGRLRHPTFGHRDGAHWVTQEIRPGFWDDAGTLAAEDARKEIDKAVDIVAAKLEANG